jgi:hypothetical protein
MVTIKFQQSKILYPCFVFLNTVFHVHSGVGAHDIMEIEENIEENTDMTDRRIHNPKTGRYYKIRERTTKKGKKGQIMGNWKNPKDKKKSFWDKW